MNEKVYLIQFEYGNESYSIPMLSHFDYTKGRIGDKIMVLDTVGDYIRTNNLHIDGTIAKNIRLFGKEGNLIVKIDN